MAEEFSAYDTMSEIYYPIAIWLEAIFYGLYTMLFFATCRIMIKRRATEVFSSRVFLFSGIVIYLLATLHVVFAVYRLVRGYALHITGNKGFLYFNEHVRWENFSHLVISALVTWIGDALVIYRCFLVWRRNFWVIAVPALLLVLSMAATFVNWRWFQDPTSIPWTTVQPLFDMLFPLNLAQNVLTTGLISYMIWSQHRTTKASGLQLSSSFNLITIFRIVVESAMIYTVVIIIIIILFRLNHPAALIFQYIQTPVIGMVFSLIAIRTHVARADSVTRGGVSSGGMYPTWLSDNGESNPGAQRRLNMPITVTTVTEQHDMVMDVIKSRTSMTMMDRDGDRTDHNSFENSGYGSQEKKV